MDLASYIEGIVILDIQNQANGMLYDHPASPNTRESSCYGGPPGTIFHSIDDAALCFLGIGRQLQRESKKVGDLF